MKKNSSLKIPGGYMFRKKITPWCILALPMAFTIWLKYYPIFSAFFISLFRYDPINPPGQFAGLQNYIGMFGMQHYWQSHHPWIVPEPFTLEPTESFSKDDLDEFAAILKEISRECYEEPETIRSAPHNAPIHNTLLDEVMDFDKIAVTYRQLRKRMEAGTISKDILGQ